MVHIHYGTHITTCNTRNSAIADKQRICAEPSSITCWFLRRIWSFYAKGCRHQQKEAPKIGSVGAPPPWDGGMATVRNTPFPRCHAAFCRSMSNHMGIDESPRNFGKQVPLLHPIGMGHGCHSRSNGMSIIKIHLQNLTPCIPPFKLTFHENWHGLISYLPT